jgi:hypothetical protein
VLDREARDSVRWTDLKAFKAPAGLKAYAIDSREDYQWDDLPASTSLTESQASLCPPLIDCHGVATKKPYTVSIEKLEPADWNSTAMQQLVLPADEKAMLQGLVAQHYLPNRTKRRGDIIAGKGEGLVILLHGPPGVSISPSHPFPSPLSKALTRVSQRLVRLSLPRASRKWCRSPSSPSVSDT